MKYGQAYLVAVSATIIGGLAATAGSGHKTADAAPTSHAQPVSIVSPLPLPVTGTVMAEQSGSWNVGLIGSPTVTIGNTPTVTIGNTASQALFARNADEKGRIPYQFIVQLNAPSANCQGASCAWQSALIPAGHRLVVEHVSGDIQFATLPTSIAVNVQHQSGASIAGFSLPLPYKTDQGFEHSVLFYVDAGQFYVLQAFGDAELAAGPQFLNATGTSSTAARDPAHPSRSESHSTRDRAPRLVHSRRLPVELRVVPARPRRLGLVGALEEIEKCAARVGGAAHVVVEQHVLAELRLEARRTR